MSSSPTPPASGSTGPPALNGSPDIAIPARSHLNGAGALAEQGLDVAVADWDLMFDAVRSRLVRTVGELPGEQPLAAQFAGIRVRAAVLDCVRALDRLHVWLEQERSQRPTP